MENVFNNVNQQVYVPGEIQSNVCKIYNSAKYPNSNTRKKSFVIIIGKSTT